MKKLIPFSLVLFLVSASCSDDPSVVDSCGLRSLDQQSTASAQNACAIAVSATGKVAVTRYNGYDSGYGAVGSVTIAASVEALEAEEYLAVFTVYAPEAVVFDSADNVFVSETEQVAGIAVFKYDSGVYSYLKTIQDDFNNPRGLAFDGEGRLFMADDGTGRIIKFDTPVTSDDHSTIGNWDAGIKGLAIRGNVMYVTNYNSNVVSRNILKADGTPEILDASADIYKATDVSVRGNVIVVTSFDDSKIYVLSDCDFNEENMRTYDNLGKCFGTAFINDTKLAGGFLQDDEVRVFSCSRS